MAETREIFSESGTEDLEVMEFTVDGNFYGIDVAKVTEIMLAAPVKGMPHTHPAVEGVFKPRDRVLTVVDLPRFLGSETPHREKDLFIITCFSRLNVAFRVHTVEGIGRISRQDIQKPEATVGGGDRGVATGIAQCGESLVTILDLEKIAARITPESAGRPPEADGTALRSRDQRPILAAEDSVLLSKLLQESLRKAGYSDLTIFPSTQELWEYLCWLKEEHLLKERAALLITDTETPQIDGYRLTGLVKNDPELKSIPLVIFSARISEEMRARGEELGADEQLSKPEIGRLAAVIDQLLAGAPAETGQC